MDKAQLKDCGLLIPQTWRFEQSDEGATKQQIRAKALTWNSCSAHQQPKCTSRALETWFYFTCKQEFYRTKCDFRLRRWSEIIGQQGKVFYIYW